MPQFRKWFKKNRVGIVFFAAGMAGGLFVFGLGLFMVYSDVMFQSIIQAEATILGFLGLIAAYLLTSYDARLDRLEQQRFDLEADGNKEKATFIIKRMKQIRNRKSDSIVEIVTAGASLTASLLFSITTQGLKNLNPILATVFNMCSLFLFSLGTAAIFIIFFIISKESEEP